MRPLAIIALALFVAALYAKPLPARWTHEVLPSCYMREKPWAKFLGPLKGHPRPKDAKACWASRGGYLLGTEAPANFVVLKEWPQ